MKRLLGPGRISRDSVLRSFEEIQGYDYQEDHSIELSLSRQAVPKRSP
jgi:hypothetical protein